MLTLPAVAAVIVGARSRTHLEGNLAVSAIMLSDRDLGEIAAAIGAQAPLAGDVYALERDRTGRHGAVMKYNLNKGPE